MKKVPLTLGVKIIPFSKERERERERGTEREVT